MALSSCESGYREINLMCLQQLLYCELEQKWHSPTATDLQAQGKHLEKTI